MPKAIIIPVSGQVEVREVPADLEAIRREIGGGWLEHIAALSDGTHMYIDEDGKAKQLQFNPVASALMVLFSDYRISTSDFIAGTAVIFGKRGPEEADVSERAIKLVARAQAFVEDN